MKLKSICVLYPCEHSVICSYIGGIKLISILKKNQLNPINQYHGSLRLPVLSGTMSTQASVIKYEAVSNKYHQNENINMIYTIKMKQLSILGVLKFWKFLVNVLIPLKHRNS